MQMAFELATTVPDDPDSADSSSAGRASPAIQGNAGLTLPNLRPFEKRRDPRYSTNDQAVVEVLGTNIQRLSALVLDVSRSGLRLGIQTRIGQLAQVEITLPREVVIFGEVRYCRPAGTDFHAGVLIADILHSRMPPGKHIHDDELGLYLIGKGLTAPELIELRKHVICCKPCRSRLMETEAALNPARKGRLGSSSISAADRSGIIAANGETLTGPAIGPSVIDKAPHRHDWRALMKTAVDRIWKLRIWADDHAQDLIEYALMASFVAVSAGAIMPGVAISISKIFSGVISAMTAAAGTS
jgi:Flp pilus assembly pilin Flp